MSCLLYWPPLTGIYYSFSAPSTLAKWYHHQKMSLKSCFIVMYKGSHHNFSMFFQPKFFRIGGRGYGSFRIEKHKISISIFQFPKLKKNKKSKLSCLVTIRLQHMFTCRVEPWFEIVKYIMFANPRWTVCQHQVALLFSLLCNNPVVQLLLNKEFVWTALVCVAWVCFLI